MDTPNDRSNDLIRNGAQNAASQLADGVRKTSADVAGSIRGAAEAVADRAEGTIKSLTAQARQAAGSANDLVRNNPWQALGIAALAGVVIGLLVSRRD
jgi:ElaB/YqjD/DUF883 family membrane-anchored ribosome-binding protein